ncbi:MAG: anti-sigma factor, partial [Ilumatobacteraceae bacterium]|nr:anti-sigma factor [Ilumatobacteraceae bacterium]
EQPDSQVLSLDSQGGAEGTFRAAWSNSLGEAVLMGEDLPTTPDDKAYELWLITPDSSTAMYVLDPAKDGNVHHTLKAPADPSAWAITVEPAAGSATATGDIIFVANV